MFSMKLCRNRFYHELIRDIRRSVSKTSMDKNSDAISMAQSHKMQHTNLELNYDKNVNYRSYMKQVQHTNTRASSTIQLQVDPNQSSILASKEQSRDFIAIFPEIIGELTDVGTSHELFDVMRRFARVLQYNTPTGVQFCAMILISLYKSLEDPQKLTPENIRLANILGWCVEMCQSAQLILDDIMDSSETRRGTPCWYLQPQIGLSAVNDAVMMENAVYGLLRKYFRNHPAYASIMEIFHDDVYKTTFGQSLDAMFVEPNGKPKLEMFTMDRYTTLIKYKSTYTFFHLPVATAMCFVGMYEEEQLKQIKMILEELGKIYQVQNDFLDCFSDPAVTGKKGNDIEVGKCSWLAVMALEKATPAQRKIMEEHYGRSEPESVAIICRLYEDLCLPNVYTIYEENSFNTIRTQIQQISKAPLRDLFFKIVTQIYKRVYME